MNIAFPAILIFLLVLPGFIFHTVFWRTENTQLNYSPFSRTTAIVIILSAVLHILWVTLSEYSTSYTIDFETITHLLIPTKTDIMDQSVKTAAASVFPASLYFLSLYIGCFLLGHYSRLFIIKFEIDYKYSIFKFDAPWYYLLKGYGREKKNIIRFFVITALVDVSGKPVLYTGTLDDYYLDKTGQLEKLVLRKVKKQTFQTSNAADSTTIEIALDFMIIPYSQISNLSFVMFVLERQNIPSKD